MVVKTVFLVCEYRLLSIVHNTMMCVFSVYLAMYQLHAYHGDNTHDAATNRVHMDRGWFHYICQAFSLYQNGL